MTRRVSKSRYPLFCLALYSSCIISQAIIGSAEFDGGTESPAASSSSHSKSAGTHAFIVRAAFGPRKLTKRSKPQLFVDVINLRGMGPRP